MYPRPPRSTRTDTLFPYTTPDRATLRARAALGFRFDSSFNAAWAGRGCAITLDPGNMGMRFHHGMCEVPVSGLMDGPGSFRPAQLCAMSKEEMRDALDHAAASGAIQFSAFSHSFKLLSRDRTMANRLERKSTRLNSSHYCQYRMPSSA